MYLVPIHVPIYLDGKRTLVTTEWHRSLVLQMRRYGCDAANAKNFHDTSLSSKDVVCESRLEERLSTLLSPRPVRLVYCGRLVPRKGLDHSLRLIAAARARGAAVTFDVIGDGPQRADLEAQARSPGPERRCASTGRRNTGRSCCDGYRTMTGCSSRPPLRTRAA